MALMMETHPMNRDSNRRATLAAGLLVCGLAGACSLQSHQQSRQQAEARWEQVRARVKFQLAKQQYENGQIDAALTSVTEAIGLDDSSADQYLLLAHCHLEKGNLASARQATDRAAQAAPNAAEVAYAYGLLAEAEEQPGAALDQYRKARELDGSVMDYLVAEAECLVALGRHDEAVVLVSDHLGRFDSKGTLEMLLAQIAMLVGDRQQALTSLRAAAQRAGDHDLVTEEYGRLLSETGRDDEALAILQPYVARRGEAASPSAILALSAGYLAVGQPGQAKPLLHALVGRRPNDARGWTLLVRAAMATRDWTTSRRCADEVERLDAASSLPYLVRGYVCWKQNDLPGARASLERALALRGDDAVASDLLQRVLEQSASRS